MAARNSLMAHAVRRLGVLKGTRVLTFMIAWDISRRELGDDMTIVAYAEWWKQSERNARYEIARFHELFPDERNPTRIMAALQGEWEARRGVRGLGDVTLDRVAVA
jgi:hypothetical protein